MTLVLQWHVEAVLLPTFPLDATKSTLLAKCREQAESVITAVQGSGEYKHSFVLHYYYSSPEVGIYLNVLGMLSGTLNESLSLAVNKSLPAACVPCHIDSIKKCM